MFLESSWTWSHCSRIYNYLSLFNATYNSCIVAVSFIGGGNRRNMRKSLGTPRHEHDFKFTTLVVISSCKSYYNEITFTTTLETSEQKKDTVHRCDISEFFIIVYCLHFMLICHQKLIADWYIFKEWLIKTTVVTCILVLCVFVLIPLKLWIWNHVHGEVYPVIFSCFSGPIKLTATMQL
jgi:hypothetical protein